MPPVAAEIFGEINGATSSRGRSICYITTWLNISYIISLISNNIIEAGNHSVNVCADKVFIIYQIVIESVSAVSVFFVKTSHHIAFAIVAIILLGNFNP